MTVHEEAALQDVLAYIQTRISIHKGRGEHYSALAVDEELSTAYLDLLSQIQNLNPGEEAWSDPDPFAEVSDGSRLD
jgi:hypothetical protein